MVAAKFIEQYRRTDAGWKISEVIAELHFSILITKGRAVEELSYVEPFT